MRLKIITALSTAALLAGAAQAQVAEPAQTPAADPAHAGHAMPAQSAPGAAASASAYSEADLTAFNTAMVRVRSIADAVQGGAPTAEQQAEMAAAVEASGLGVERFNTISSAVSSDPVLQARLALLNAPQPAAGSVAANVSDAEVEQFSAAMRRMRDVTAAVQGSTPTAEQQAEMAATVQGSGLAIDRFNAIATAVSQDPHLRARVELADARRASAS